jgi:hypothetical protein
VLLQSRVGSTKFFFRGSDSKVKLRWHGSLFEEVSAAPMTISAFPDTAKTVASRNEMIVEIISLFAFTFKIPFH